MENTVQLLGHYGSDEIHACSAWTSTNRDLNDDKRSRIPKLLKMLAEAGHHTPFEKSSLHFLVDCDIASHIHIIKHRIGVSVNGESARYKELKEDKYYLPEDWKDIKKTYAEDDLFDYNEKWIYILEKYTQQGNFLYHQCLKDLEPVLGRKRAKESARFFKTYNSQIQADVMFNFRSFVHFLNLRHTLNDKGEKEAQEEIYNIADKMLNLVKNIPENPFKFTLQAFNL